MSLIEIVREAWGWSGVEPEAIVDENDFGNLIIRDAHAVYWRLCPEELYCNVIANSRTELDALSHDQAFLADWYMSNFSSEAKAAYGLLRPGFKYHFVIPGVLGGQYAVENIRVVSQSEQIRVSGGLGRQIKDLPDGVSIRLNVTE